MEDLLSPPERESLTYLRGGPPPADPAEMVARKAAWLLERPGGVRAFKVKIGRVKWMESFDAALERDIAVVRAVRRAIGGEATLLVDGNDGYWPRPAAAADFAEATAGERLYWLEEMFGEELVVETRELKRRLRAAGLATKLADGENHPGGIPPRLLAERFPGGPGAEEALFDVNQPDMNTNGFLRVRAIARASAGQRVTVSPHNFGSKLGLYAQAHLGLVTPNWEFCEADDSAFPALRADGVRIADGRATLTGLPGLGVALEEAALEKPTVALET
jgi:D-galactarolactone cycloisomerase